VEEQSDGVITAKWAFKFSDTPPAESPTRFGRFNVYKTMDALAKGMPAALANYAEDVRITVILRGLWSWAGAVGARGELVFWVT
jgi:hypothetical protein